MEKMILCNKCQGAIKSKYDLVVTMEFLSIVPYHENCYSQDMKRIKSVFLGTPINSSAGNFGIILGWILSIIMLFLDLGPQKWLLIGATILGTLARIYSWYMYERKL